jgi:Cupin domain
MPKMSKDSATDHDDAGPVERWHSELDGYAVDFLSWKAEIDSAPILKGLPDDRCPCPHWGYVLKGRVTYTFAGHSEVHEAGDAFYVPGGHVPHVEAGTEYIQFSPADQMRSISETIERNLESMRPA